MKVRAFALVAACLLAISSPVAAQATERESLAGLDGLYVLVENLNSEALEGGLTREALQTYLEMRLRQARIPILSEGEAVANRRAPRVYLNVLASRPVPGLWVYKIGLYVMQRACIVGWPEGLAGGCFPSVTTWGLSTLHMTPEQRLPTPVREDVATLMDMLVNDYLAVNP